MLRCSGDRHTRFDCHIGYGNALTALRVILPTDASSLSQDALAAVEVTERRTPAG